MVLFLEESKLSYRQKLCMGYKWNVATHINDNNFVAEIRIPFSSFFYDNSQQFWRFNIYRGNTQINESSTWIKIPQNQVIGNLAFMGKWFLKHHSKRE